MHLTIFTTVPCLREIPLNSLIIQVTAQLKKKKKKIISGKITNDVALPLCSSVAFTLYPDHVHPQQAVE